MLRRIFAGILIFISSVLLMASVLGIGLVWVYNGPLTDEALTRLEAADHELVLAQTAIRDARAEMQRTLRIVETAEQALASLKDQTEQAKKLFEEFNQALDESVIPGLQSTRGNITQLKGTLVELRGTLERINSFPLIGIEIPGDELLGNLIKNVDDLNAQIQDMQDLAQRASVFTSDTSFVLGGDMTETKQRMYFLLGSLIEYDRKVTAWHVQLRGIIRALPEWIDQLSIGITIFLFWFGLSQLGMLLHALNLRRGGDPFEVIRSEPVYVPEEAALPRSSLDPES
jgi:hypothetical protein